MADGNGRDRAATSAPVRTPMTPGTARAADTSTATIRAWASMERTTAASAMRGNGSRSSMNQPSPRRRASSSTRSTGRPTQVPAGATAGLGVGVVRPVPLPVIDRDRRPGGYDTCTVPAIPGCRTHR